MNPYNPLSSELAREITLRNSKEAKALAHRMASADVGAVLQKMAGNEKSSIRLMVLEIAAEVHSEGGSRAILSRLQDPDPTVVSVANSLIGACDQRGIVPDLFSAMEKDLDPAVKGAIARQIGLLGDVSDVPQLRSFYRTVGNTPLRMDVTAAMARLRDAPSIAEILQRLSEGSVDARVTALDALEYVGDPQLAMHFEPVLRDSREAATISFPHVPRTVIEVRDVAVGCMGALRLPLSFPTRPPRRFSETEIEEALQIVKSLQAAH